MLKIHKRRENIMNQQLIRGRQAAKPTSLEKKGKELDLISTQRVPFNQWAKFMAFKSENLELANKDFLFVASSPLFSIRKLYRKMPIMVCHKLEGENKNYTHAILQGNPTLEFIRTGNGAGNEGTFHYVVTTEGNVGYIITYNPEWDEVEGPEIMGNTPMKASCMDELKLKENDFIFQAGRRLRQGDYCCSENTSMMEKIHTLLGKTKGGREVDLSEVLVAKGDTFTKEPVSFVVKSTRLQNGVQKVNTTDGRTGYNIIRKNDIGFLF